MRNHHRLGLGRQRLSQQVDIHIVGRQRHIDKNRHSAILQNRRYRRRKSRSHCNDLIAFFNASLAQFMRRQRHKSQQIG